MRQRLYIVILLTFIVGIRVAHAQDVGLTANDPPYPCPYSNATYFHPDFFPRYEIGTTSLVMVDAASHTNVRTLDTFTDNVRIINWSPDCHYLTGSVGEIRYGYEGNDSEEDGVGWNAHSTVIWNALNGGRVYEVVDPGLYIDYVHSTSVIWSGDNAYALILSGCRLGHASLPYSCIFERERYDFLWQRESQNAVRIGNLPIGISTTIYNRRHQVTYDGQSRASFNQYFWDTKRGWLWSGGPGGVSAYDLNTGEETAFFENIGSWPEARFVFSQDDTKLIVYSIAQYGSAGAGGITIYDIATHEPTSLNVEGFAAPYIPLANYHPVALSPDNRYLVVGYEALRVWDIQNLLEKVEDRLPIYRHAGPKALIWSVWFSDWGIVETNSEGGLQHWDLHTGQYIPS